MTFQVLAIAFLALLAIYAFDQRKRSKPLSYAIIATSFAGAVLVAYPNLSTSLANMVGIGRGADLVAYIFMLIVFAAVANLQLRMRANDEAMTLLARELALSKVEVPANEPILGPEPRG